jgi:hypothetical protein
MYMISFARFAALRDNDLPVSGLSGLEIKTYRGKMTG